MKKIIFTAYSLNDKETGIEAKEGCEITYNENKVDLHDVLNKVYVEYFQEKDYLLIIAVTSDSILEFTRLNKYWRNLQ